jgi:hypothetical protein
MKQTKQDLLIEALQNGEQLTSYEISARFGIKNPTAAVSNLRLNGGYAIYSNKRVVDGEVQTKFRLGRPSRAVVAAGYRALAAQAV